MRLAWLTDIHLNFVGETEVEALCRCIVATQAEAVLIAGDIAEAGRLTGWLGFIEARVQHPICFVLGNHDYYGGQIAAVRERVAAFARASERLCWLDAAGVVPLTARTGLIGHGSWADGRYGDYANSTVRLNDHLRIADFLGLDHWGRARLMARLGDEAAVHMREVLPTALERFEHVVLLTHVPPFAQACRYEGRPTAADFLPHFSCRAVGDALLEIMAIHPQQTLTVLCGHTHNAAEARPLPNLRVLVGAATYGQPEVQPILDVE